MNVFQIYWLYIFHGIYFYNSNLKELKESELGVKTYLSCPAEHIYHSRKRHQCGKHPYTNMFDIYYVEAMNKYIGQKNKRQTISQTIVFDSLAHVDKYIMNTMIDNM